MAEYKETDQEEFPTDENGEEETVELRRLVVLDKKESYPINGVNKGFAMGDVIAVRHRQGRRYIEQVDDGIMQARWAEEENEEGETVPEEPYEVKKSELKDELGKVGEVPRLKDKLEAMQD